MRVVVLGRNGMGSRSHYVTRYYGPWCIWLDMVFFSHRDYFLMLGGII